MTATIALAGELQMPEPTLHRAARTPFLPAELDRQITDLQGEIDSLRQEINLLRRRDETLNYYMNRLDEELRLAAKLQQDFLPKTLPQVEKVKFHSLFRPAGYVSGDLYDVARLDEAHIGFSMADAVGHGMPAALLTMFIKNALVTKEITSDGYRLLRPGEALGRLNDTLVDQNLTQATFATAFYGMVNCQTLVCRFARAGHPIPVLLRGDGSTASLQSEGGLLGIIPHDTYTDNEIQLASGDRLFVYSDGVEVAFSPDQTIDAAQWVEELKKRRHLSVEQLLTDFTESLDRENGSLQPRDDLSIIVLEVK